MDVQFAANDLIGKTISGWKVIEKLPKPDPLKHETGGTFSICYIVEKDGEHCFMKVLDYEKSIKGLLPLGWTRATMIQSAKNSIMKKSFLNIVGISMFQMS